MTALRQAVLAVCCSVAIAAAAASDLEQRLAGANLKRGQMPYLQCKACHDVEAGLPHKVGRNPHGIFGRKAGIAAGFKYTDAMHRQRGRSRQPDRLAARQFGRPVKDPRRC